MQMTNSNTMIKPGLKIKEEPNRLTEERQKALQVSTTAVRRETLVQLVK